MADFDSDDLDFSDREESPSRSRIGQKSVQLIFEHAAADRVATKKLVRQLQFTDGGIAPKSRINQSLWVKRLDSMRTAWGQNTSEPFSGEDLIRFFAAILRKSNVSFIAHFFLCAAG
jgi:hypothetical protein